MRIVMAVILFSGLCGYATSAAAQQTCRFATFGDLMAWGEATFWAQDWTDQYIACGAQDLSGDLEYAFNNEWHNGNRGHPVYGMPTNSAAPLTIEQQNAEQCAQLLGQIEEYRAAMTQLDPSYSGDLYALYRQGIEVNQSTYNSMCQ